MSPSLKFVLVLTSVVSPLVGQCPLECRCLWRSSKVTVECSHLDLSSVPAGIDSGTQVLNMSSNNFPTLPSQMFVQAGLNNLQKIFLQDCSTSRIDPNAFSGLLNLVELDLSKNKLLEVPVNMFQNTLGLMGLSLRRNPISSLKTGSFKYLRQLSKLDISHCRIETIDEGAFQGLVSLERLYLDGNNLSNLDLPQELPPSLHGVTLHDNPWHCDCRLIQFRLWLGSSNVPRTVEPTCHSPDRILGFRVEVLSLSEFACTPSVSPTSMYLSVNDQKNVSIVCRVVSEPSSQITWYFKGLPIESKKSRMRVFQQFEANKGTRSELIISNTSRADNGTYTCVAENKAGRAVANYSLHVNSLSPAPRIMELRLEQFVAVAVSVIVVLVLLVIVAALLLVKACRTRMETIEPVVKKTSPMPRSIQMGTGQLKSNGYTTLTKSQSLRSPVSNGPPDLLNGVSTKPIPSDSSGISVQTTMTHYSSNSCSTAMSTIIHDYGPNNDPIIGMRGNLGTMGKSKTLPCLSDENSPSVWSTCPNPCQKNVNHSSQLQEYPTDFGLPRIQRKFPSQGFQEMHSSNPGFNLQNRETYIQDTPYLHTSGFHPIVVPKQKQVLPDEMYPEPHSLPFSHNMVPASLQYQDHGYSNQISLTPSGNDPFYESIRTVYQPNNYSQIYDPRHMYQWVDPWNPRVPSVHSNASDNPGSFQDPWNQRIPSAHSSLVMPQDSTQNYSNSEILSEIQRRRHNLLYPSRTADNVREYGHADYYNYDQTVRGSESDKKPLQGSSVKSDQRNNKKVNIVKPIEPSQKLPERDAKADVTSESDPEQSTSTSDTHLTGSDSSRNNQSTTTTSPPLSETDKQNLICQNDSSEEILKKLSGPLSSNPGEDLESEIESAGIAEELENAFQHLDHNQDIPYQDEGPYGTEI